MINVAIIGATGYTAEEAIKIILRHPQANLTCLTAREDKCGPVGNIFPALQDRLDISLELANVPAIAQKADGRIVRSVADVRPGDPLRVRVRDGVVEGEVRTVRAEDDPRSSED